MNEAAEQQRPSRGCSPIVHRFPDAETLAGALAERIAAQFEAAIAARAKATLVLSGGRTPIRFFERLREHRLRWAEVIITLADERWVPPTSKASNERLVRDVLLSGAPGKARFFGLKNPAPTADQGVPDCEEMLGRLPRPYDAVMLGMGDDGHFASLFPGTPRLDSALDLTTRARCVAVDSPAAPHQRISQTLAALLDTRTLILHLEGAAKWRRYEEALTMSSTRHFPVRALLVQRRTPVEVYWSP